MKIREIKYPRKFKFYIDSKSKASRFAKLSTCKDGSNLQFAKLSPREIKVFYSIWVFANHTHGNECKQNVSTIFVHRAAFHAYLSSWLDSTYVPDESWLFWSWEKPEYPQFEPHARMNLKWCMFWDLPCISVSSGDLYSCAVFPLVPWWCKELVLTNMYW